MFPQDDYDSDDEVQHSNSNSIINIEDKDDKGTNPSKKAKYKHSTNNNTKMQSNSGGNNRAKRRANNDKKA